MMSLSVWLPGPVFLLGGGGGFSVQGVSLWEGLCLGLVFVQRVSVQWDLCLGVLCPGMGGGFCPWMGGFLSFRGVLCPGVSVGGQAGSTHPTGMLSCFEMHRGL